MTELSRKKEQVAWYENPDLKNLYIKAASNTWRNYHGPIITPKTTFTGTNSLVDFINHVGAFFSAEDKRVLIVVDKDLRKMGEKVAERMKTLKNIESRLFDNVLPDVPKYTVMEGVEVCNEYEPKMILAIGGGSAMDTAKMIFLWYEQPNINLNTLMAPSYLGLRKKVPILAAIPTTSGTGAETTFIAVVTDTDREPPKKTEAVLYELCPDFVVLNTEFVKSMPPYLTMGTGMDALAHAMGAYVLVMSNEYTDMHNLKAIELILDYLPRSLKRPNDMEARHKMQLAAYIAGVGFGNVSGGVEHGLGHSFGALFHAHHGVCVAMFLPISIAFQAKVTDRFIDIAKLFEIEIEGKKREDILRELLEELLAFMKLIGCPTSIKEHERPEIPKEEYEGKMDQMIEYAYSDYVALSSTRKFEKPFIEKMYQIAYENNIDDIMSLYYM